MQNIQWSRVHAGDAYQFVTCYSPVAQSCILRKETDDQLMSWFAATVTESKLTELSCCLFIDIPKNWVAQGKRNFITSHWIYIDCGHGLKTKCVLIKHSIMRHIIKMNKHGKYVLGFREISMAETGFHNKLSPPEISRIRKNKSWNFCLLHIIFRFLNQHQTDVDTSVYHNHIRTVSYTHLTLPTKLEV